VPAALTTLASGLFLYGLARAALLSGMIAEVPLDRHFVRALGQGAIGGVPMPILVFAVVLAAAHFRPRANVRRQLLLRSRRQP